jgi:anthranilate phosphoribosyltransferase
MFAQAHHPAMKYAGGVRRELATRTIFNILGPLTNPAGARCQMIGVYSKELVRPIAEALVQLGSERAFVVHGAGGLDELSPIGRNDVCEVRHGEVIERVIDPLDLGVPRCQLAELHGGDSVANAAAIREVFQGSNGGRRNAILLNAAGAIAAAGLAEDLAEGLEIATETVASRKADERLEQLIAFSNEEAAG